MPLRIIPYNPKLKELAYQLRNNMTGGEIILWQHLKGKQMQGYNFDRQRQIDQFIVDFYCKRLQLAIEIDGSCHDSEAAQAKDRDRQARLESLGVVFLRFRDDAVRDRTAEVVAEIREWIVLHESARLRDLSDCNGK